MHLYYENGSCQYILSDSSWLSTTTGPLLESSWYGGEEYDARQELIGWDTPTYDHTIIRHGRVQIPQPYQILTRSFDLDNL